ncbi:MAG: thiamine biosynthesis protein ThiS [Verrucomicrobiales bacterium]|nr:thiamine biosynthesis protein ThiS [Verrucomicrobiales bacterium]MBV64396.1 thiamine biosynthesis protein ThiS [Rickettsiales bacterium]|tara:strand:+ start:2636 stop:2839 length:204 start_codon:yes stop_codon:yes gene_type:complete
MIITINGKSTDKYSEELSVEELLEKLSLANSLTIVELNKIALKKKDHQKILIKDRDIIEIVQIAAGG